MHEGLDYWIAWRCLGGLIGAVGMEAQLMKHYNVFDDKFSVEGAGFKGFSEGILVWNYGLGDDQDIIEQQKEPVFDMIGIDNLHHWG
jgi:hypothetical protein